MKLEVDPKLGRATLKGSHSSTQNTTLKLKKNIHIAWELTVKLKVILFVNYIALNCILHLLCLLSNLYTGNQHLEESMDLNKESDDSI